MIMLTKSIQTIIIRMEKGYRTSKNHINDNLDNYYMN